MYMYLGQTEEVNQTRHSVTLISFMKLLIPLPDGGNACMKSFIVWTFPCLSNGISLCGWNTIATSNCFDE